MYIDFLAPAVIRTLSKRDILVVRSFSGQKAGGPTTCFVGEAPIFMADLFRPGMRPRRGTEFIPTKKRSLTAGFTITNIVSLGTCLFGEDFTIKYRGQIVNTACKCKKDRSKSTAWLSPVVKK